MSQRFCPKCGSTKGLFIKNFCANCFLAEHALFKLPSEIRLARCRTCGKTSFLGKWTEPKEGVFEKLALKNAKTIDLSELEKTKLSAKLFPGTKHVEAEVSISGFVGKEKIFQTKKTRIVFQDAKCDSCSKQSALYHEAIIQVRGEKQQELEKILSEAKGILSELSKKDFLARIMLAQEKKNGFDLLIGSKKSALKAVKQIAKKHKAKIVVSFRVTGSDREGNLKKRFTYCIKT